MKKLLYIFTLLTLTSCETKYQNLPAFSAREQVQMVVETPAGSSHEFRYKPETNEFKPVQEAGQDKRIGFLPYPVNAGFIPGTRTPANKPLRVLLLNERLETGTTLEITPIGVLLLERTGELEHHLVAVPARPSERVLEATYLEELVQDFPAAKHILETWFLHAEPKKQTRLVGWKDEKFADQFIRKHLK